MKTKLVLFDIDQTILHSGGAGEKALIEALRDRFGRDEDLTGIEIAGKTDVWIARRLFEAHGIQPTEENVENFLNGYLHHLETELGLNDGRLLPGFPEIFPALARLPHVAVGLLTGNLRRGAQIKLGHFGMLEHFSFEPGAIGAFADDSHDRNQLGPFAQRRARDLYGGEFAPKDIYIIGDTPHDIACAKAIHANAVGVATGHFNRESLEAAGADYVFEDLSDTGKVIQTLGLGPAA